MERHTKTNTQLKRGWYIKRKYNKSICKIHNMLRRPHVMNLTQKNTKKNKGYNTKKKKFKGKIYAVCKYCN